MKNEELKQFAWVCHPKAEALVERLLKENLEANPFISQLQKDLLEKTSTRLQDWVDHIVVSYSDAIEKELDSVGYVSDNASTKYRVFHHPGAQLPRIVLNDPALLIKGVAVSVESISDFLMVRGMAGRIEGTLLTGYRRCCASLDNGVSLWVVERRGSPVMEPVKADSHHISKYIAMKEKWKTFPRNLEDEDEAMKCALITAEEIISELGQNMAAWVVLEVEREYWQAHNHAAQLQKNRQDQLGMGWANHDHHTFRSSRRRFHHLVRLFEMLGFHCRERFYAGQEAGWGAQVMENSSARLVLFLDVDLSPDEIEVDFAHHPLPEADRLGTVGLWCALHGDSILKAGMHHLEAQFMFSELEEDLKERGVGMMQPFSNFSYLKQAFTKGEIWQPDPKRVRQILNRGFITQEQADKFLREGAIGSHMENLQRREGYKGFNQKNVSFIIKHTDPRTVPTAKGA
jgi:hypothetical protein